MKAGAISGIPQLDITLPASLPSFASATTTTVKLVAANGDQVMCVQVMTKAAPAEVAAEEWFAAAAVPSAAPSGTYTGSKSVLGKSITATLKIDGATAFDLGITGAATLSCANEAYSYNAGSSSLQLPNIAKTGDCIHDALAKQSASIKSITYDAGADTISVTVKKSFLSLVLVLTKTAEGEVEVAASSLALPGVAAEEWFAAAAAPSAAPSGTYTGSKSVLGKSITATLKIDGATAFDLGITGAATLSCANEAYSYNAGSSSLQLPNIAKTGDCIHDALAKQSASIKSITYDAGADTISVTVKKSFLSLVLVLTKTAEGEVEVAASSSLALTYKDCGVNAYAKVTSVAPNALPLGKTTTISGTGQLSKDVAAASFDIQTTGITGSLGHCTSADASTPVTCALKVAGLPVGTMVYHGIPFPIKAGALTGIPQVDITLPASLPSFASATTTTLKVTAANGDQVMCVQVFTKAASAATDTMKALRGSTQIA